jgi:hypothetical protein
LCIALLAALCWLALASLLACCQQGGDSAAGGVYTHGSTGPPHGHSSEVGQGAAAAAAADDDDDADGDQAPWLRELQMQLAAAATAEDEADDLDYSATAQSSMQVLRGGCSHDHQQQQQQQQQQLGVYGSQSATPPAITADALESHLLQQLLQDMQLSPQLQQLQQPSPLLQQQAMQPLPPQLVVQQSTMSSLLPPQQLPLQHVQQQQASQQQQRQLLEHIQQQLQAPAQQQQQQQQQLQPPRQLSPEQMQQLEQPSYSSYLPQPTSGCITQSCPLPNVASENWQGGMRHSSNEQGMKSLSSALPEWQQQQQGEMSESASMAFKKRDRQQLFQQLLQGAPAAGAVAGLMWRVHDCKLCRCMPHCTMHLHMYVPC